MQAPVNNQQAIQSKHHGTTKPLSEPISITLLPECSASNATPLHPPPTPNAPPSSLPVLPTPTRQTLDQVPPHRVVENRSDSEVRGLLRPALPCLIGMGTEMEMEPEVRTGMGTSTSLSPLLGSQTSTTKPEENGRKNHSLHSVLPSSRISKRPTRSSGCSRFKKKPSSN